MRLFARMRFNVAAMSARRPEQAIRPEELPARLHDVATGMAIASGLLKGAVSTASPEIETTMRRALELLEDSLRQLRTLTATTAGGRDWQRNRPALVDSIQREAGRLKIRVDLELEGKEDWLPSTEADLVLLVCREALRNVRRHAGASVCGISIDLASCPFSVRIKDWGAGIPDGADGGGLRLLSRMAADMGCQLGVSSQPGFGTEVVLVGPVCARDRAALQPGKTREFPIQEPQTSRHHTENPRRPMVKT